MADKIEFRIQEVAGKLKLPRSTIRYWETEFLEHLRPRRTNGGQRRYNEKNISMIQEIKRMREQGMSLVKIKRILSDNVKIELQDSSELDFLANRVAKLVKGEVYGFLREQLNKARLEESPNPIQNPVLVENMEKPESQDS